MMRKLAAAGVSDVGRVRDQNEDTYLIALPFACVADGMGGHTYGDAAARILADALGTPRWRDMATDAQRITALNEALHRAQSSIRHLAQTRETALQGDDEAGETVVVGATLAGVLLCPDQLHWLVFHVGDSRVYLWRDGALTRLTKDHSYVQALVDAGALTPVEADKHPARHVVLKAVDSRNDIDADVQRIHARAGDVILICSDGLTDDVSDSVIEETLGELIGTGPQAAAYGLRDLALSHGGHDNVTALVVTLGNDDDTSSEEEK
ncbi:serine/threonine-protein phosphatase [Arcanobacterium haemolyticum]|nr:serine/threonine-protein phosphatase [Arcanobacterium haemolyticum]